MDLDAVLGLLPGFFDQSEVAIAIKAPDGRYLFANRAYGRYLQAAEEATVGHRDRDLMPAQRFAAADEAERAALRTGRSVSRDEQFVLDGQTVWFVSTRFPILDERRQVAGIGVLAMDLTEQARDRVEAQTALRATERANTQLRTAVETLEQIAGTDRLTRAWNRRRFDEVVESEIHRSVRYGRPLSVLMLDIDHFKRVNDEHGHQVGDRVLVAVARKVREVMRRSDSLTRWGGEEFLVMAPDSGLAEARVLAERIRERVASGTVGGEVRVTVSIGAAVYAAGESAGEWIDRADRAMYEAKRAGRDRVELDRSQNVDDEPARAAGSFVQLAWRDAFHSGNELIDTQHRALFQVSNELLDAVLSGHPQQEVSAIVGRLLADVVRHFRDEERVLVATSYAGLVEHAREHALLVVKGTELAKQYAEGTLSVGSLFQFLVYDMVALHMLGADRKYYPWVSAHVGGVSQRADAGEPADPSPG